GGAEADPQCVRASRAPARRQEHVVVSAQTGDDLRDMGRAAVRTRYRDVGCDEEEAHRNPGQGGAAERDEGGGRGVSPRRPPYRALPGSATTPVTLPTRPSLAPGFSLRPQRRLRSPRRRSDVVAPEALGLPRIEGLDSPRHVLGSVRGQGSALADAAFAATFAGVFGFGLAARLCLGAAESLRADGLGLVRGLMGSVASLLLELTALRPEQLVLLAGHRRHGRDRGAQSQTQARQDERLLVDEVTPPLSGLARSRAHVPPLFLRVAAHLSGFGPRRLQLAADVLAEVVGSGPELPGAPLRTLLEAAHSLGSLVRHAPGTSALLRAFGRLDLDAMALRVALSRVRVNQVPEARADEDDGEGIFLDRTTQVLEEAPGAAPAPQRLPDLVQ